MTIHDEQEIEKINKNTTYFINLLFIILIVTSFNKTFFSILHLLLTLPNWILSCCFLLLITFQLIAIDKRRASLKQLYTDVLTLEYEVLKYQKNDLEAK